MRIVLFICLVTWGISAAIAQSNSSALPTQLTWQMEQAPADSTRLRLCVAIAYHYYNQQRFDSLYAYIQQGLHLLTRVPNPSYASDIYFFLARYYRYRSLYKEGITPSKRAIYFAQQARNANKIARNQYSLAMIYADAGDWQQAIHQIQTNLKYIQTVDLHESLTDNYLLIIELFKELHNKSMQVLYTNRFIAIANQGAVPEDRMYAYELKAGLLAEQGHWSQAITAYQKAVDWAWLASNTVYRITMLNELGTAYRHQGQYQTALSVFNRTFAMARANHVPSNMAIAQREMALTYLALQQPKQALIYARYALQSARSNRTDRILLTSLACLGQTLEANGLYREAIAVYQEQYQLKEAKYTEKNLQQIAQLQAQFETETKEKTIKILQKNAQIDQLKVLRQEQQLSQSRQNQLTSVIVISLLFILIGVVYFFLHRSQQAYTVLQQTARALSETNEVKNKLFSIIGHDLRSPIASMKTTLYQAQASEALTAPVMTRLKRQVDGVLDLLTNLLDWSLMQLEGIEQIQEPIQLNIILEETISQAEDLIGEKQLGLINQVSRPCVVLGNQHQLRAVIRNLLSNAIKFTPVGGYIRLYSVQQEPYVELIIRDSGIGMTVEQLSRLLSDPEIRSGTMGETGTGLGLRISRELVERQGGSLHVESGSQIGTLVKIRLPLYAAQATHSRDVNFAQVRA